MHSTNTHVFGWYYKILALPPLPDHLEQKLWERYRDPNLIEYKYTTDSYLNRIPELSHKPGPGDVVGKRNGKAFPNGRGSRYKVQKEVETWVEQHITTDYVDIGLYVIFGNQYDTVLPHTDQTRVLSLLYLLEPGGPATHTDFWKERDYSVHREMKTFGTDYDRLELLVTEQWPLRKWVLLNTNILHSVEELIKNRVQFQVSLDREPNIFAEYIKEIQC